MIEGLNPPTTEDSLKAFINTLRERGAKIKGEDVLAEPYCEGDWCLMIINKHQIELLKNAGIDIKCHWRSLHEHCIIYIARQAMELLELNHTPDSLTISTTGGVDRVSLLGSIAKLLNAVRLSHVGAVGFSVCIRKGEEGCLRHLVGEYDDEYGAFIIEVERKDGYDVIGVLPRRIARVYDPYLSEMYYVAWDEGGRILAYSKNLDSFLAALKDASGGLYGVSELKYTIFIGRAFRRITMPLSAGLNEDGTLSDPYGILDTANHGVDDLINIYNWINKYYGLNARYAWLNVVFIIAKVITPIVRKRNQEFIDHIIWNRGSGSEGKTTLFNEVGKRLLGVYEVDPYLVVISGSVTTQPQLRELVNLNRLPLIIDEQHLNLTKLAEMLHASAVGQNWVGLHASRYGSGSWVGFRNFRGIIVSTNMPFKRYFDEVYGTIGGWRAIVRRFIELAWANETLPEEAFDNLPLIKGPVYGLLMDLMRDDDVRNQLLSSRNLLDLSERLMDALGSKYPRFKPIADQTIAWLRELASEKASELKGWGVAREELRLADYARRYCGPRVNDYCMLRALLEHGERDNEVVFTEGRDDNLEEVRLVIDAVLGRLFNGNVTLQNLVEGNTTLKVSEDALEAFRLLAMRLSSGQTRIVFKPGTTIVPGRPSKLLGAEIGTYSKGGEKYKGYSIRIDKFLKWLFLGEEPQ